MSGPVKGQAVKRRVLLLALATVLLALFIIIATPARSAQKLAAVFHSLSL